MLNKMVNGVEVKMSAEEEDLIRAEWTANAAKPATPAAKPVDAIINDPVQMASLKAALAK